MSNVIANVFKVIGVLLMSLILWQMLMGSAGRTLMWNTIEPAMQRQWSVATMQDGKLLSDMKHSIFEKAVEYEGVPNV